MLDAPVSDETGLSAKYDFTITYARSDSAQTPAMASPPEVEEPEPDIFAALRGRLGLILKRKKVPVQVMAIDHIDATPSGN